MSEVDNVAPEATDNATPAENDAPQSMENFGQFIDKYAPEEYKDAGTWEKFRNSDPATALKTIADMDKYIGQKGDIPQEGASPEQKAEFAKKIGFTEPEEGKAYVNLSAEQFGESAQETSEIYNAGIADVMGRISKAFSENPSMASIESALAEWAMEDAGKVQSQTLENQQLINQQLEEVAGRYGLSPDQLKESNNETLAKYGWNLNELTAFELLHVLGKETTGSNTLKDSLVSTPAGKQARLQEIYADPDFMDKNSPNYQKLVQEHYKLMDDLMKG